MVRDEGFRARLRAMGQRSFGGGAAMPSGPEAQRNAQLVQERVGAAMAAGVAPGSPEAAAVVAELVGPWAAALGRADDEGYRQELLDQLELAYEPRAERYWQLIAVINGWPPIPSAMPYWAWLVEALKSR
jgi:hypothetical protein